MFMTNRVWANILYCNKKAIVYRHIARAVTVPSPIKRWHIYAILFDGKTVYFCFIYIYVWWFSTPLHTCKSIKHRESVWSLVFYKNILYVLSGPGIICYRKAFLSQTVEKVSRLALERSSGDEGHVYSTRGENILKYPTRRGFRP